MSTETDIESRLRALESREDDREALRRRLEGALARADALERELTALRAPARPVEAKVPEVIVAQSEDDDDWNVWLGDPDTNGGLLGWAPDERTARTMADAARETLAAHWPRGTR